MKFPTLYARSSTGKIKVWNIEAIDGSIIISYGYENGVQQTTTRAADEKNTGRANMTTPFEQAEREARARWEKKQKQNYATAANFESEAKNNHETGSARAWAMLALDYHKRGHNIKFPCFVQPKIDGIRSRYSAGRLFSRGGDEFAHHRGIFEELARLNVPFDLDGEMYSSEILFEQLAGIMNKDTLSESDEAARLTIQFHIFDCIAPLDFTERIAILQSNFKLNGPFRYIVLVETEDCTAAGEVDAWLHHYINRGFEGAMFRNAKGIYKGNGYRSKDLQKYKLFKDEEFEIIGYKEGKGKYTGCVIWQCQTDEGRPFFVKPACSEKESRAMLSVADTYIGQFLTVKYQERTTNGVPRFPVAKCFARKSSENEKIETLNTRKFIVKVNGVVNTHSGYCSNNECFPEMINEDVEFEAELVGEPTMKNLREELKTIENSYDNPGNHQSYFCSNSSESVKLKMDIHDVNLSFTDLREKRNNTLQ